MVMIPFQLQEMEWNQVVEKKYENNLYLSVLERYMKIDLMNKRLSFHVRYSVTIISFGDYTCS